MFGKPLTSVASSLKRSQMGSTQPLRYLSTTLLYATSGNLQTGLLGLFRHFYVLIVLLKAQNCKSAKRSIMQVPFERAQIVLY